MTSLIEYCFFSRERFKDFMIRAILFMLLFYFLSPQDPYKAIIHAVLICLLSTLLDWFVRYFQFKKALRPDISSPLYVGIMKRGVFVERNVLGYFDASQHFNLMVGSLSQEELNSLERIEEKTEELRLVTGDRKIIMYKIPNPALQD